MTNDLMFPAYRATLDHAREQGVKFTKPSIDRLEEARQKGLDLAASKRHLPIFIEDLFLRLGPQRAAIVEEGWLVPMTTGGYEVRKSIRRTFIALCEAEHLRTRTKLAHLPVEYDALKETIGILEEEIGEPLNPTDEDEDEEE